MKKAEKVDFFYLFGCLSFLVLAIMFTFLKHTNKNSGHKLVNKDSSVNVFAEDPIPVLIECGRFGWVKVSAPQCPPVVGMEVTMSTIPHLLGWVLKKDCVADLSTCTCPGIGPILGLPPIPLSEVAKWLNNPVVN